MNLNRSNIAHLALIVSLIKVFSLISLAQNKQASFEINIDKAKIKAGETVELNLILKNVTNTLITVFDDNPERSLDIIIKNDKGIILPLTKEGRRRKFPDLIIRRASVYLEPGKELRWKIDLNNFFDINQLGNYETIVKITYNAENKLKKGVFEPNTTVSSNKVKFKLVN